MNQLKSIRNIHYYTGLHPKMKLLKKTYSRPTEFGHKVWDSSFILIDYLNTNNSSISNKSILEIGCGWGLLGIYLAKNHSCNVICSDLDESVLPITQAHAELNKVNIKTKAASFSTISDKTLSSIQCIVGVEVCYNDEATHDLADLIHRAYNQNVETILIADPGRPDFLDHLCSNYSFYKKTLHKLPGTKNGKTTYLLELTISK